ncbi:MAG: histidinol-phosphate transaminase [Halarsenatibacteraceae bacterium]
MKLAEKLQASMSQVAAYEAGQDKSEIKKKYNIEEPIKLASNENPYGASPEVKEVIAQEFNRIAEYPASKATMLRKSLADFYDLSDEMVFTGNGTDEIIGLLVELFNGENYEIIYPDPSFAKYKLYIQSKGADGVAVPLDDELGLDLDGMAAEINEKTGMIFICDPNNPTGTMCQANKIKEFIDRVPDDILIVLDQAYHEYMTSEDYYQGLDELSERSNLLILRTFSKAYGMAGLRIGYGLGSPEIIHYLDQLRDTFNCNRLGQRAAIAALKDQQHIQMSRAKNQQEKKYLYQELEKAGIDYVESEANFLLIAVPGDSREAAVELESKGIIVKPGAPLGVPGMIRVTVGTRADNEVLIEKLIELYS